MKLSLRSVGRDIELSKVTNQRSPTNVKYPQNLNKENCYKTWKGGKRICLKAQPSSSKGSNNWDCGKVIYIPRPGSDIDNGTPGVELFILTWF